MSTATKPPTVSVRPTLAPALPTEEQRFLLEGIRWETYEHLCQDLDGQRWPRMNYDQGRLEFVMTVSRIHEIYKLLLGHFIMVLAEELNFRLALGGSMTFRREDIKRGLEPDACFWIRNAALVQGKRNLDFTKDPAPDLALEVEITHGLLDRIAIYAALQVPEVWRLRQESLGVGVLQPNGTYQWGDTSPTFPDLPLTEVVRFLKRVDTDDDMSIVRSFRVWVRANMLRAK